ncbi:MAG TPA: glycosyltransferase family 39 protein [Candidatus Nitrosotenuis sp.]|nr:glycosyltransferase family 39 protein [Candidatus Nitrosotenuis sp.]
MSSDNKSRNLKIAAPRFLPIVLLGAYLAQCAWFIGTQSFTYDEPHHIKAGLDAARDGNFDLTDGHPGLPRMYFTLPLLFQNARVEQVDENTATGFAPAAESMAWQTRAMQSLLGLALGVLLWRTARKMFSEGAANFALALFAFSPALIAHFSLATTDAAGVLMIFIAATAVVRWRKKAAAESKPLWPETLLLGVVLGVLLVSKYYTPPLFLLALVWMLTAPREGGEQFLILNPLRWHWRSALLVCVVAFLVVWGSFYFHLTHITLRDFTVRLDVPGHAAPLVEDFPFNWNAQFSLPAVEYLAGLGAAAAHTARGHRSYFLGEVSARGGWRLYFPVVIVLKWPSVALLLLLAALVLLARKKIPLARDTLVLFSFPVLFFIPAVLSKINIGDRHILPAYPFVLLLLAGVWEAARHAEKKKLWSVVLALSAVVMAADTLRYAPDYLSWFNIFVDKEESWRLLADSSLDWGQGLLALRAWQQAHPDEQIYLAYYGNVAPEVYDIRYTPLKPGESVRGIVVVSAVHLAGRLLQDQRGYRWLLEHRRVAVLNHTLHVFRIE